MRENWEEVEDSVREREALVEANQPMNTEIKKKVNELRHSTKPNGIYKCKKGKNAWGINDVDRKISYWVQNFFVIG